MCVCVCLFWGITMCIWVFCVCVLGYNKSKQKGKLFFESCLVNKLFAVINILSRLYQQSVTLVLHYFSTSTTRQHGDFNPDRLLVTQTFSFSMSLYNLVVWKTENNTSYSCKCKSTDFSRQHIMFFCFFLHFDITKLISMYNIK